MAYTLRPATPQQAKPLIGMYAESGAGKTYTALLLARGFVGPKGTIAMIETEAGRGEAYANPAEYPELAGPDPSSNYGVIPLRDSFSPQNYGDALTALEKSKVDAAIIDSGSHEWEGTGGVLDMAARSNAHGVGKWQQPKLDHKRHFMLRITQTPIPLVIVCMRARFPMVEKQKEGGGKDWVRADQLSPIQADDILYEMFVHGWIDREHRWHGSRYTTRGVQQVFAPNEGKMIDLDTGRRLADWSRGLGAKERPNTPSAVGKEMADRIAGGDDWAQAAMDIEETFRGAKDYATLQKVGTDAQSKLAQMPSAEQERLRGVWQERSKALKPKESAK